MAAVMQEQTPLSRPIPGFVVDADPDIYFSANYVVLDFEIDTSHGDYGHPVHPDNQMLLASWKLGTEDTVKSVWGSEYELGELISAIERADFLVAQNAKYELGWLKRCGLDLSKVMVFDTRIAEYVLAGNLVSSHRVSTSLQDNCLRRGWKQKDPVVDNLMKAGINPVRMPRTWLQGRCEQDVKDTERLMQSQRDRLDRQKQLPILYTRCLLTPVLADIEFNGMQLDEERVFEEHAKVTHEHIQASNELDAMASINWNSGPQVAEFVYGELGFKERTNKKGEPIRTDGGKPKTDADTLALLKPTTAEQKAFMSAYKRRNAAHSALTKGLDFFKMVCEKHGGLFHAEFNQCNTATHRLSSSGIEVEGMKAQFQNLANRDKPLFRARNPDYDFAEWDGSGLEFRGAGLISQDPLILEDINNPEFDPHRRTASVIYQVPEDEVTKDQRKKAKEHTFKPLFGGQSGTKDEKRYYAAFNERYSGLVEKQTEWLYTALGDKKLRLPWGMTFYFPDIKMDQSGYIRDRTKIFNYPIQSVSTAEIIPLAVVYFYHLVKAAGLEDKILLVNTVHDSVLCEVHKDYLEEYKEMAKATWFYVYWYFENVYDFPLEGIPLGTEITWGTHWTEGEEESWNIYQDGRIEKA